MKNKGRRTMIGAFLAAVAVLVCSALDLLAKGNKNADSGDIMADYDFGCDDEEEF